MIKEIPQEEIDAVLLKRGFDRYPHWPEFDKSSVKYTVLSYITCDHSYVAIDFRSDSHFKRVEQIDELISILQDFKPLLAKTEVAPHCPGHRAA